MTSLTATPRLLRAALRRDRVRLPVWLVAVTAVAAAVVATVDGLYPTLEERASAAAFNASNVVARAFNGPASGAELGALAFHETFVVLAVLVGVLAAQTVVRHTRHEEETGRAELVGAAVVGRQAPLVAALLVAAIASVGVGVGYALVFVANGLGLAGAVSAGLALGATALVVAGVAAVAAQVAASARTANGLAAAAIGVAFLLRAVGDAAGEVVGDGLELRSAWPAWLSPVGWGQQVRPYGGDHLEVLLLAVVAVVATVVVALVLSAHRDVGAGLVAPRPGPARAGADLRSAAGLAWRLQRPVLAAWVLGMGAFGAAFGALGDAAEDLVADNPQFAEVLGADGGAQLVERFLAFTAALLAVFASAGTVQLVLRLRTEEATGRLEPVLATATSRLRWLGGHLGVVTAGTALVVSATGLGGALAFAAVTGDLGRGVDGFLLASWAALPAILVLGAVVAAVVGLAPRAAPTVGWSLVVGAFVVQMFGDALELPGWLVALSPFTHVPDVPVEAMRWSPVVALLAVALACVGVAAAALRRRDLVTAA